MPKIYKCDKCLHEFSRKQHLNQHYNRKFPCVKVPTQVRSCEDIHGNILPYEIASGNIITSKILPADQLHCAVPLEIAIVRKPEFTSETVPEQKVEGRKPNLTHAYLLPNIVKPNLDPKGGKFYNQTIKKTRFQVETVKLEKINEYDWYFKRVKKFFQSDQVMFWLQEEGETDPITPSISLVDLRRWYGEFKAAIENEYHKVKILD